VREPNASLAIDGKQRTFYAEAEYEPSSIAFYTELMRAVALKKLNIQRDRCKAYHII
jgi:hypothetical protein